MLALDVLRGLAIALVLVHHTPKAWLALVPLPKQLLTALHRGGWIGVDLFFVLSGFLVARLLFREYAQQGSLRPGRFLVRRALKIYPAFYLFLATTVLVSLLRGEGIPQGTVPELLFVQNYFTGIWGHTWSLAVEEHFYLLLPLTLVILVHLASPTDRCLSWVPRVCVALCVAVFGVRLWTALSFDFSGRVHFYPTHARMDALWFGVLLAHAHQWNRTAFEDLARRFYWWLLAAGTALCAPAFLYDLGSTVYLHSLGMTQFYVGSGLCLWALVGRGLPSNRFTRSIAFVGLHSYAVYLWHPPVRDWGTTYLGSLPLPFALTEVHLLVWYLLGSLAVGVLTARLVEFPILRLRDRLVPSLNSAA